MERAESKASRLPDAPPPNVTVPEPPKEGYCRVREGDTLYQVSGREEVYGDPLKWVSLFQLNREALGVPRLNILHRELSPELELRYVTRPEAIRNRAKFGKKSWVVNVLSLETPEELVPYAIALMREDYPVYMTKATVKGKDWFRLRVGFFKDRTAARTAAKEIMAKMDIKGSWVADAPEELEEYGGYMG
jgi:hypothetical protein